MRMELWKKIILALLATAVLLAALLLLLFFFWLGPTAKALAENIGTRALGTRIGIESLSIDPRRGTLDLHGFQIGTYEGFNRTNTCQLARLHIALDARSLFSDTIVIHSIEVDSPYFTYEQNEATDNISEFIRNIQAFAKTDPNQPKKKKNKPTEENAPKVVVEALVINDMQMHLANTDQPELDIQLGVERLTLSLTNGLLQLDHLVLSNPGLLSTPSATEIESIGIQIDPDSIYSAPMVVEEVRITKPYAYFEQNSETDTLLAFMQVIDTFAADTGIAPPPEKKESPEPQQVAAEKENTPPVMLRNLVVDDFRLHLVNTADPRLNMVFKLGKASIGTLLGTVDLEGFSIGNPGRLATPHLFDLQSIHIELDPASLLASPLVVEKIQIEKPHAFLERNPETDTISEFMKISNRFAARIGASTNAPPPVIEPKPSGHVAETPPVKLRNIKIDDIRLNLLDSTPTNRPAALRTLAAINQISAHLEEGSLRIDSITVPNPPGFAATNLFQLGSIQVAIDPNSLFSSPIIVGKIFADSPKIHLEQTETSGNLGELLATINGFIPKPAEAPPRATAPIPAPGNAKAPPAILDTLQVSNLCIRIVAPIPTNMPREGLVGKMDLGGRMHRLNPLDRPDNGLDASGGRTAIDLLAFDLLSIEPRKGLLEIHNLEIGNPEGFANKNLVEVDRYRMDFNPASIQGSTFIIEDILFDKPRIAYERKLTTDNIEALQELIDSILRRRETYTGTPAPEEPEKTEPPPSGSKGGKVVIEHLELSEGIVRAKISKLPTIPVIPLRFEMNDLGKEEGGTSIQEAFGRIFGAFYDAIIGVVGNASGLAGDTLKGAGKLTLKGVGTLTGGLIGTDSQDEKAEEQQ